MKEIGKLIGAVCLLVLTGCHSIADTKSNPKAYHEIEVPYSLDQIMAGIQRYKRHCRYDRPLERDLEDPSRAFYTGYADEGQRSVVQHYEYEEQQDGATTLVKFWFMGLIGDGKKYFDEQIYIISGPDVCLEDLKS